MQNQLPLLILLQFCVLDRGVIAADFSDANLGGAHLTNADMRGSNLRGANLRGADLSGTDLTGSNITQQQLDSACGAEAKLPAGLVIKPCAGVEPDTGRTRLSAARTRAILSGHGEPLPAASVEAAPWSTKRQDRPGSDQRTSLSPTSSTEAGRR